MTEQYFIIWFVLCVGITTTLAGMLISDFIRSTRERKTFEKRSPGFFYLFWRIILIAEVICTLGLLYSILHQNYYEPDIQSVRTYGDREETKFPNLSIQTFIDENKKE